MEFEMKIFHKCTLGGLVGVLKEIYKNENFRLCCSSLDSVNLFNRSYCIEMEVPEDAIIAKSENDIDSHTITSWDEIRIIFKKSYIKRIIGSKRFAITDSALEHCGSFGILTANNDRDAKLEIRDILSEIKITSVIESGYSKRFLNI